MSEKIEARNHCSAVVVSRAMIARKGRVTMVGHEKDFDYDPDDVAAVAAEAIRQREEIAKRKLCVREFFFGDDMYTVTLESDGTAKVWHHQGSMIRVVRLAEMCTAAYRELVAANGGDHGPQ